MKLIMIDDHDLMDDLVFPFLLFIILITRYVPNAIIKLGITEPKEYSNCI